MTRCLFYEVIGLRQGSGLFPSRIVAAERILPGNPINNSFNSKFSFGFLIPLSVWKQFKKARDEN